MSECLVNDRKRLGLKHQAVYNPPHRATSKPQQKAPIKLTGGRCTCTASAARKSPGSTRSGKARRGCCGWTTFVAVMGGDGAWGVEVMMRCWVDHSQAPTGWTHAVQQLLAHALEYLFFHPPNLPPNTPGALTCTYTTSLSPADMPM